MNRLRTRTIILINALLISIIALISYLIIYLSDDIKGYVIIVFAILVFCISFITINFSINKLVLDRILPLYKLIQKTSISDAVLKRELKNADPILTFTKDFDSWTRERSSELKQLTELKKYRKEFLGNVAHELKTPLFNIQGYIYTLLDGGLEDTSINRKYLERTDKSIDRLIAIIKDLDSISRLESGELELIYEEFNIAAIVDDIFEMQELRARNKNIRLEIEKKPLHPLFVMADKKRIFQVINNLVVNSINYGKENGYVKISFFVFDQNVIVDVSDDGLGIKKGHLPRIFERFYRVDKSRSREQGGTGLGLSIVKHIIEAHNQTINVRSEIDKGTSIAFTLTKSIK